MKIRVVIFGILMFFVCGSSFFARSVSFLYSTAAITTNAATQVALEIYQQPVLTVFMEKVPQTLAAGSSNNSWKTVIQTESEKIFYRFFVDRSIVFDPNNPRIEEIDGQLYNVRDWSSTTVALGDGKATSFRFEKSRRFINPVQKGEVYFSVEFEVGDIEDVDFQSNADSVQKTRVEYAGKELYRFRVFFSSTILKYRFKVTDGESFTIGYEGTQNFFTFDSEHPEIEFMNPPEWSKGCLLYQIFPDRFRNGNPLNDLFPALPWEAPYSRDSLMNLSAGGDLEGIIQKIPYLRQLGVQAIYLNPIFEADSTHKYNTTDYETIDKSFGTQETFSDTVKSLHSNNIRIILDGVFNHTGSGFFAMQENLKSQQASAFLDWYYILNFPIEISSKSYRTWSNYAELPKLNTDNSQVRAYLSKAVSGWMLQDIDGWRLDTLEQLPIRFWEEFFYPFVKSISRETLVVGEYWKNAEEFFEKPAVDSVMNYLFRDAVLGYVKGGKASRFLDMTNEYLLQYPPQMLHSLWNLLSSHDTERFLTSVGQNVERMKIAVVLQMTFVGSPVIYYGDEIGLTGENDPFCRKPFPWDEKNWNLDLNNFYRKVIEIRNRYSALRTGDYTPVYQEDGVLVYERKDKDNTVWVLTNSRTTPKKLAEPITGRFTDLLTGEQIEGIQQVEALQTRILLYQ